MQCEDSAKAEAAAQQLRAEGAAGVLASACDVSVEAQVQATVLDASPLPAAVHSPFASS